MLNIANINETINSYVTYKFYISYNRYRNSNYKEQDNTPRGRPPESIINCSLWFLRFVLINKNIIKYFINKMSK